MKKNPAQFWWESFYPSLTLDTERPESGIRKKTEEREALVEASMLWC